jgi:twitching motility protein PilT
MEMEQLLALSVSKKASDLHIMPGMSPLMRIYGSLVKQPELEVLSADEARRLIFSIMTDEQLQEFQTKLVVELGLYVPNIGNFRVSVLHQLKGIAAVFRVIPEHIPSFEELALPPVLKTLLKLSHGLILVTGPTGSGKSTTLAAMIDFINTHRSCNIITIEDPIEFTYTNKHSVFHQLEVGRDTPDFSTALRSSLRQDANVILLGELRDLETMRLALTAAETGHLVMATLHASSAPIAISRFTDVFPSEEKNRVRTMLSETLQAVVCQTLVKCLAGGRVAAFEILFATQAMRHFIRQDMSAHMESAMQTNGDKGMCTLEQYLHDLVVKRVISPSVAATMIASRGIFRNVGEPPADKFKK